MSTIYYNGTMITMEGRDAKEMLDSAPEAILVEHGLIAAAGTLFSCREQAPDAEQVDLKGHCLMPSFIDTHSHLVMNGQMALCADLSACGSFEDIIRTLKTYIAEQHITVGEAVMGFGYDHNFLKEQAQPDKRVLDQVSTEIPIMILHVSAHLACVNSAALKLAGVDEHTSDPEGGLLDRLAGSREPSGYLEETAMTIFSAEIGKRMRQDMMTMFSKMQEVYLKHGVTTAQDGASTASDLQVLRQMNGMGLLKLDAVSYPIMPDGGIELMQEYGEGYREYDGHLKIGGYKLVLDGSPQGRSAWLSEPYLDNGANCDKADSEEKNPEQEKGYRGYPWMSDEEVLSFVNTAISENKQLLVHCNGDAASEQYLNAYEKALQLTGRHADLRPVMIHCQTVRDDQLDRMAKLKMIASVFVGHVYYWGDVHLRNLGEKRGNHISPVRAMLDRGISVNFHQDTPVTKPNMLHTVWCAVNRMTREGRVLGADQRASLFEALKAVTIDAAYMYFEEDSKGSMKVGKRADLVILDKSPFEVDPMEIKDIQVLETIKDGETVYSR